MSDLVRAHIAAMARLRAIAAGGVQRAWTGLRAHNEDDVPAFLAIALPVVLAAQRQSVSITDAFLGRMLQRRPIGVLPDRVTGAAVRAGVTPQEVYRRPFVAVWTALAAGTAFEEALAQGMDRATAAAATDVQLAMRATLQQVGQADPRIAGYKRVADPDACPLCLLAAGQRYQVEQLMPIHPHCGCGVEALTDDVPAVTDLRVTGDGLTIDVREHGELGPVLVNADHHFSEL